MFDLRQNGLANRELYIVILGTLVNISARNPVGVRVAGDKIERNIRIAGPVAELRASLHRDGDITTELRSGELDPKHDWRVANRSGCAENPALAIGNTG